MWEVLASQANHTTLAEISHHYSKLLWLTDFDQCHFYFTIAKERLLHVTQSFFGVSSLRHFNNKASEQKPSMRQLIVWPHPTSVTSRSRAHKVVTHFRIQSISVVKGWKSSQFCHRPVPIGLWLLNFGAIIILSQMSLQMSRLMYMLVLSKGHHRCPVHCVHV